jgi:Tol biopolymer transport system component
MGKVDLHVKLWIGLTAPVLVCACGQRSEVLGVILDGGSDASALEPPRFSAPVLVGALSDVEAIDEDPTFTGDLLELYFMSNRAGTRDIWTARRASADDPWGSPSRVAELSSSTSDWAAAVSLDGLRIWFSSDRLEVGRGQIWASSRSTRSAPWSSPQIVAELATSGSIDFAPAVDATETTLLFASNRADPAGAGGGANFDLYSSTRAAGDPWRVPAPLPGANGGQDEYDPFVAQGSLVVFFTSMRSGLGDIYWSARRSIAEPFPAPLPLDDLNSPEYDSDSTLSVDLGYLMFSSTRSGNAEIYESRAIR